MRFLCWRWRDPALSLRPHLTKPRNLQIKYLDCFSFKQSPRAACHFFLKKVFFCKTDSYFSSYFQKKMLIWRWFLLNSSRRGISWNVVENAIYFLEWLRVLLPIICGSLRFISSQAQEEIVVSFFSNNGNINLGRKLDCQCSSRSKLLGDLQNHQICCNG